MLDWLIFQDAPQLYTKEELLQLEHYYQQLSSCSESYIVRNNTPRIVQERYVKIYFICYFNLFSNYNDYFFIFIPLFLAFSICFFLEN